MRRVLLLWAIFGLACAAIYGGTAPQPAPLDGPIGSATDQVPERRSQSTAPDVPLNPQKGMGDPLDAPWEIQFHPDEGFYIGDRISLEVIAPPETDLENHSVSLQVSPPHGPVVVHGDFGPFGLGARSQATLRWAWDTAGFAPGDYTLRISIHPDGPSWDEIVTLKPRSSLPAIEALARWEAVDTQCCRVYFISHTAAARDLQSLVSEVDAQAALVAMRLGVTINEPVPVVLLPRLVGHGGYAGGEIYVSYPERNYTGSLPAQVFHHELVHSLDQQMGGDLRPAFLAEGLAVYLSGGHFKSEPLMSRAATLPELGWYLPMAPLIDRFYAAQHEIGYMQAGAFVKYLVDSWGWETFMRFYQDIHPHPSGSTATAVDEALQRHYGLSLSAVEKRFLSALRQLPVNADLLEDVKLTVRFYETVRRYQRDLDPSAYFLFAWLPPAEPMRRSGVVADYLRYPNRIENVVLESLLVSAEDCLRAGRYDQAQAHIDAVNAVLDLRAKGWPDPFGLHPLASDYLAIVSLVRGAGYTPSSIQVRGDDADVLAIVEGLDLRMLDLTRGEGTWIILN